MEPNRFLEIGRIINTHGVRGEMKLEPWADGPEQLQTLKTVYLDGREVAVRRWRTQGRFMILGLDGFDPPEAAMALKGKVLAADRKALPLPEGRYYIQDLIGLPVQEEDGTEVGKLTEVMEYPAGRIFVVKGKEEHLIPEKGGFILSLDPALGHLIVRLPEGM